MKGMIACIETNWNWLSHWSLLCDLIAVSTIKLILTLSMLKADLEVEVNDYIHFLQDEHKLLLVLFKR